MTSLKDKAFFYIDEKVDGGWFVTVKHLKECGIQRREGAIVGNGLRGFVLMYAVPYMDAWALRDLTPEDV